MAMVPYVGCNQLWAVIYLCSGMIGAGIFQSGYGVNHVDIAPKYAGVLFGISNMIASSTGFFAPAVVGLLTEGNVSK